jgi:glycerophosphoryl diester phosphodiesterase
MFSWTAPRTTPLIIAHRGASRKAPENTLAAFSRAIEDGADGIELDVRLTADGALMVFHDSRLTRTTDGHGKIERCTLDELKGLSAGSWFHPLFRGEPIPTLDDALELMRRRVGVNIELKLDPLRSRRLRLGRLRLSRLRRLRRPAEMPQAAIVHEVLRIIRRHRMEHLVLLSSFHHHLIRLVQSLRPGIATGYLFHTVTALGRAPLRRTRRGSAAYLIVNGTSCSRRLVSRAHQSEICVGEYTINSSRRLRRAVRFGVDAVYTDDPASIIAALRSPK